MINTKKHKLNKQANGLENIFIRLPWNKTEIVDDSLKEYSTLQVILNSLRIKTGKKGITNNYMNVTKITKETPLDNALEELEETPELEAGNTYINSEDKSDQPEDEDVNMYINLSNMLDFMYSNTTEDAEDWNSTLYIKEYATKDDDGIDYFTPTSEKYITEEQDDFELACEKELEENDFLKNNVVNEEKKKSLDTVIYEAVSTAEQIKQAKPVLHSTDYTASELAIANYTA